MPTLVHRQSLILGGTTFLSVRAQTEMSVPPNSFLTCALYGLCRVQRLLHPTTVQRNLIENPVGARARTSKIGRFTQYRHIEPNGYQYRRIRITIPRWGSWVARKACPLLPRGAERNACPKEKDPMGFNAAVTGWGWYSPAQILSNQDLEKLVVPTMPGFGREPNSRAPHCRAW